MRKLSFEHSVQDAETNIKEKGIVLTPPSSPDANYVNPVWAGNLPFPACIGRIKADNRRTQEYRRTNN